VEPKLEEKREILTGVKTEAEERKRQKILSRIKREQEKQRRKFKK